MVYGFLGRRERGIGGIGASETVERLAVERCGEYCKIVGRNHAVGVEEYEIVAFGAFHAVVARYRASLVVLEKIFHRDTSGIFLRHVAAWLRRTILDEHHLEIARLLRVEAFEQVAHFVDAVVDGNND